jgi:sulfate permease, SulP family
MNTGGPRDDDGYAGTPFRAARKEPLLQRAVPVTGDLPDYGARKVRGDLIAALTVAALAVPSAMAYAELAGLSPVAGLYALLLPTVAYALFGSSRRLVVGPEGSISALVGATVLASAAAGSAEAAELAAMLALLVAACFLIARLARLGWVADYLSRPVLIGYIHGVAVVLVISQVPKLLGLDIDAGNPLPQLVEIVRELGDIQAVTLAVGALALGILLPLRYVAPRVPAALLVVVGAIIASGWLDLASEGVAIVGDIPSGLPELAVPSPSLADTLTLLPAALGIFFVCFADAILTARSFAGKHNEHVDVGQELLAMGAAQASAGLTRVSRSAPAGRGRPSTTRWARAPRLPDCSPPRASCSCCSSSPARSPSSRRRCSALSSSPQLSA